VTVAPPRQLSVVAPRTKENNGYVAPFSSARASRKINNVGKADAAISTSAQVDPKRRSPSSASKRRDLIPVCAEIHRGPCLVGHCSTGRRHHTHRQGLPRHAAMDFSLPARQSRRVGFAPFRSVPTAAGRIRPDLPERKMPGHRARSLTTLISRWFSSTSKRGSSWWKWRCRQQGRLDAVATPSEAAGAEGRADAGQVPPGRTCGAPASTKAAYTPRSSRKEGACHGTEGHDSDGEAAGDVTLSDEIFGLEARPDNPAALRPWQARQRRRGTHYVKNRAEINRNRQ